MGRCRGGLGDFSRAGGSEYIGPAHDGGAAENGRNGGEGEAVFLEDASQGQSNCGSFHFSAKLYFHREYFYTRAGKQFRIFRHCWILGGDQTEYFRYHQLYYAGERYFQFYGAKYGGREKRKGARGISCRSQNGDACGASFLYGFLHFWQTDDLSVYDGGKRGGAADRSGIFVHHFPFLFPDRGKIDGRRGIERGGSHETVYGGYFCGSGASRDSCFYSVRKS